MFGLQPVRIDLEGAVLLFEQENRAYFTRSINDRGDRFFEEFAEGYRELMAEQRAGTGAFYLLVDEHGAVVGRFNLYNIQNETADVGYRVAERVSGGGVATSGLLQLCRTAREDMGLQRLTAAVSDENVASQKVLVKAGFVAVGRADVAGRHGSVFELDLATLTDASTSRSDG
jgi:ribosomal-protein-alanine N-acetyltransferase